MHLSRWFADLVSLATEKQQLGRKLREARTSVASAQRELVAMRDELSQLRERLRHMDGELRDRETATDRLESKVSILETENDLLSRVIERDQQRVARETAVHKYHQVRALELGEADEE